MNVGWLDKRSNFQEIFLGFENLWHVATTLSVCRWHKHFVLQHVIMAVEKIRLKDQVNKDGTNRLLSYFTKTECSLLSFGKSKYSFEVRIKGGDKY